MSPEDKILKLNYLPSPQDKHGLDKVENLVADGIIVSPEDYILALKGTHPAQIKEKG